jgi:hypothetical protein
MRTCCPKCKNGYDIPNWAVLAEAAKLARKGPVSKSNGNVLDPADAEALRERQEAINRRLFGERGHPI